MSKTVNLTIDGKKVQAPEGTNLIDAAESAGVHIPNLCYLKGSRGIGACRLCLIVCSSSRPASSPGPRYASIEVRLALS